VVVKRECLDTVGPYDETFVLGDEYDMFLRISKRFQCCFIDKGLTRYRVHDTNASKNDFLFDKENLSVYKKIYNNFTDLDGEEKKILRKRIARYSMQVVEGLYSQGNGKNQRNIKKKRIIICHFTNELPATCFSKLNHAINILHMCGL
jgi:hypothetical protein